MKKLGLAALALLLSATMVQAGTEAGSAELAIAGSLSRLTIDMDEELEAIGVYDLGSWTITGQFGANYYLTEMISIGGQLRISSTSEDDTEYQDPYGGTQTIEGSTTSSIFILGRGDLYLPTSGAFVPYGGAHAGGVVATATYPAMAGATPEEETDIVLIYGVQGGFKFFANESVSVNGELDISLYEFPVDDEALEQFGIDAPTTTNITMFLGISYYFFL